MPLVKAGHAFGAFLVGSALLACAAAREPPAIARVTRTTAGSPETAANDDAVARIATARCEREQACGKIGEGRAYVDQATCLDELGELADREAGVAACPLGIEPLPVSQCLFDIRKTPCGGALEQAPNLPSCTKVVLCAHER